jgi:hypothetical protein
MKEKWKKIKLETMNLTQIFFSEGQRALKLGKNKKLCVIDNLDTGLLKYKPYLVNC